MKSEPNDRTAVLYVRVTKAERKAFEQVSALQYLSMADWIRARLRTVAAAELTERGKSAPWSVA